MVSDDAVTEAQSSASGLCFVVCLRLDCFYLAFSRPARGSRKIEAQIVALRVAKLAVDGDSNIDWTTEGAIVGARVN